MSASVVGVGDICIFYGYKNSAALVAEIRDLSEGSRKCYCTQDTNKEQTMKMIKLYYVQHNIIATEVCCTSPLCHRFRYRTAVVHAGIE